MMSSSEMEKAWSTYAIGEPEVEGFSEFALCVFDEMSEDSASSFHCVAWGWVILSERRVQNGDFEKEGKKKDGA